MPSYNSQKFIEKSVQSIVNQTYENWELIIVDDASSDKTVALITSFAQKDTRIKYLVLQENSGTGVARNTALSIVQGRYIAFLDSDDLWKPNKLQIQIEFLHKQQIPFTFSAYDCIDETGNPLNKRVFPPKNMSYLQLFFCNYVGNLTGIYDTHFFGKIPISNIRKRQDWMLWLTILKKIKKAQPINDSLAFYRIRQNSISASKLDLVKHNFAVYRTFHGYNWPVSIFFMSIFLVTQLLIKPIYIKSLKSSK